MVIGALLLFATSALADARTEARSYFKKGMRAIAEGRYEEGISDLQRAYEILPHPSVLYNVARAYAESGDLEGAVATYRRYLDGDPSDKEAVGAVIAALERRLERQKAIAAAAAQMPHPLSVGETLGTTTPGTTLAGAPPPEEDNPALGASTPAPAPGSEGVVGEAKPEDVFEESVVTASKGAQSPLDAPNSTSIITEQDIRLSGILKIPELLRRLAGVDIMETTGSQTEVSLRGFNQNASNKILVLIDGRSTFIDLIGSTFWATLPIAVEDIERIEVVRGPGSALYGADAFNGVVNIITKAPGEGKNGFSIAYGDHNLAHGSVYVTGKDAHVAYRVSAGFDNLPRWDSEVGSNRADVVHAPSNYPDQQTSQRSVRLNVNATRDLGADVKVGLGAGYVNAKYEFGVYAPLPELVLQSDAIDATAFLASKHIDVRAFYNSLRGHNQFDVENIGQSTFPSIYNLNVVDAEAQYIDEQRSKWVDNSLHIGLGYRYKQAVWGYVGSRQENWESAYVQDQLKLGKRWAFIGDFRGDYAPYLNKIVPSLKGSILFHPSEQSTIRGIVATAFRIPTFAEAYLNAPAQLPVPGASLQSISSDPLSGSVKLQSEQVVTEELGYLNQSSDYFTFDSAAFHNKVSHLIELAPNRSITFGDLATGNPATSFDYQTGTYPLFLNGFENQCQKYDVYGAEVGVRTYPIEGLDIYANYTLMDVRIDTTACTPAQFANYVPDARTSTHKVNAGVQVRSNVGIDASVDLHVVSAQDWALLVTDVQAQKFEYKSFHLDPYALLNARLGYRFLDNHAEISGVAFNLLNAKQREYPFGQVVGQRFTAMFSYRF